MSALALVLAIVGAVFLAASWRLGVYVRRLPRLYVRGRAARSGAEIAIVVLAPALVLAALVAFVVVPAPAVERAAKRYAAYTMRRIAGL